MVCQCGADIPEIRVELGYSCCIGCSTEKKKVCFMVFSHKTAPELVAVNGNRFPGWTTMDGFPGVTLVARAAEGSVMSLAWIDVAQTHSNDRQSVATRIIMDSPP